MSIPTDEDMDKYPHVFLTADSPWDPSVLDNEFKEEFYDTVTELPEVRERHDGVDARVDEYGFLRSHEDYELLFRAQDEFIATNTMSRHVVDKHDVFYDATASGVTYYNETGTVVHDYVHPSRFEMAVNKLSSAPNYVRKKFPDLEKLKPFFGWASTDKIKNMLDKMTQHY